MTKFVLGLIIGNLSAVSLICAIIVWRERK